MENKVKTGILFTYKQNVFNEGVKQVSCCTPEMSFRGSLIISGIVGFSSISKALNFLRLLLH